MGGVLLHQGHEFGQHHGCRSPQRCGVDVPVGHLIQDRTQIASLREKALRVSQCIHWNLKNLAYFCLLREKSHF